MSDEKKDVFDPTKKAYKKASKKDVFKPKKKDKDKSRKRKTAEEKREEREREATKGGYRNEKGRYVRYDKTPDNPNINLPDVQQVDIDLPETEFNVDLDEEVVIPRVDDEEIIPETNEENPPSQTFQEDFDYRDNSNARDLLEERFENIGRVDEMQELNNRFEDEGIIFFLMEGLDKTFGYGEHEYDPEDSDDFDFDAITREQPANIKVTIAITNDLNNLFQTYESRFSISGMMHLIVQSPRNNPRMRFTENTTTPYDAVLASMKTTETFIDNAFFGNLQISVNKLLDFDVNDYELDFPELFLAFWLVRGLKQGMFNGLSTTMLFNRYKRISIQATTRFLNKETEGREFHQNLKFNLTDIKIDKILLINTNEEIYNLYLEFKGLIDEQVQFYAERYVDSELTFEDLSHHTFLYSVKFIPRTTYDSEKITSIQNFKVRVLEHNENGHILDRKLLRFIGRDDDEEIPDAGCLQGECSIPSYFLRNKLLWNPHNQLDDHDCILYCINKAISAVSESLQKDLFVNWRKIIKTEDSGNIHPSKLQPLCDYLNISLHFYKFEKNEVKINKLEKVILFPNGTDNSQERISERVKHMLSLSPSSPKPLVCHINILIDNNHAYLITDLKRFATRVKCFICSSWIVTQRFRKHSINCNFCQTCLKSYTGEKHECQGRERLPPIIQKKLNLSQEIVQHKRVEKRHLTKRMTAKKLLWFADIEAFPDPKNRSNFIPYAIGIACLENPSEWTYFFGENCFIEYMDFLESKVSGSLYYFNGSKFDGFIHLKQMLESKRFIDGKNFVMHDGSIISFMAHNKLKVKDLCVFIKSSLAKACKSWNIPQDVSKGEFNHDKVFSFQSALEHKDEVLEYLKLDVLSLLHLYNTYSKAMFDCFKIDINTCITPSQYAFACWTTLCDVDVSEILIPNAGKEEEDDRDAYYGGRTLPTRRKFISKDMKEEDIPYDEIEDYLILADVNSLYPSVQMKYGYAYGKWEYKDLSENEALQKEYILKIIDREDEVWIRKRMFQVDVTCPKNINIAFLLDRNEKGEMLHNLYDKKKRWYWGGELAEAVTLGYKITFIYQVKEFEKFGPLFMKYVSKCWQGRKDNPAPNVKNLVFKLMMNSLTGKFAQRTNRVNTMIASSSVNSSKQKKMMKEIIDNIYDFEMVELDNKETALFIKVEDPEAAPSHPIYLSAQILSNSRVYMSEIMRCGKCYFSEKNAIYYTDTDSLVAPSHCVPLWEKAGYIGSELGQMKCDLGDFTNNQFSKVVLALFAAPKGPYSIVHVNPNSSTLMEKIRAKGIPHPSNICKYLDGIQYEPSLEENELMDHCRQWMLNKDVKSAPSAFISKTFYIYETPDKMSFVKRLNAGLIEEMINEEGVLNCFFGGIKKNFSSTTGEYLTVKPDVKKRIPCKSNWWDGTKRIFKEGQESIYDLSYPLGYTGEATENFENLVYYAELQ